MVASSEKVRQFEIHIFIDMFYNVNILYLNEFTDEYDMNIVHNSITLDCELYLRKCLTLAVRCQTSTTKTHIYLSSLTYIRSCLVLINIEKYYNL